MYAASTTGNRATKQQPVAPGGAQNDNDGLRGSVSRMMTLDEKHMVTQDLRDGDRDRREQKGHSNPGNGSGSNGKAGENSHAALKVSRDVMKRYDQKFRRVDFVMAILASISIALSIVLLEIGFDGTTYTSQGTSSQVIKIAISGVTIVLLLLLVYYYKLLVRLDAVIYGVDTKTASIYRSQRFRPLCVEFLLCSLHTPPYLDFEMNDDGDRFLIDKFAIVTVIRLYLWLRVFRDTSDIYKDRRFILFSLFAKHGNSVNLSGLEFGTALSFKQAFYNKPWYFFMSATLVCFSVFTYVMYIAERNEEPDFNSFTNSLYFVGVTMTTVGYGNIVPVTKWGRVFAMFAAVSGITLAALLLTTVLTYIEFTVSERHASNVQLKQQHRQRALKAAEKLHEMGYRQEHDGRWQVTPESNAPNSASGSSRVVNLIRKYRSELSKESPTVTLEDRVANVSHQVARVADAVLPSNTQEVHPLLLQNDDDDGEPAGAPPGPPQPTAFLQNFVVDQAENPRPTSAEVLELTSVVSSPPTITTTATTAAAQQMQANTTSTTASRAATVGSLRVSRSGLKQPELVRLPHSVVETHDRALLRTDQALGLLALLSTACVLLLNESGWEPENCLLTSAGDEFLTPPCEYVHNSTGDVIKICHSVITVLALVLVYRYHWLYAQWDARKLLGATHAKANSSSLWRSSRLSGYLLESFVVILHTPPFLDIDIDGNGTLLMYDKFSVLAIFRMYVLARLYKGYSFLYNNRQWVLTQGNFSTSEKQVQFNTTFSLKQLFKTSPWVCVLWLLVFSVFVMTYCVYISERELQLAFGAFSNVLYFTSVTMTTVGYGDYVPKSSYARGVSLVGAVAGIAIAAILVTAVMMTIEFTPNERLASNLANSRQMRQQLRVAAVRLLQVRWRLYQYNKTGVLGGVKRQHYAKKPAVIVRALLQTELINAIRTMGRKTQLVRDACRNDNGFEDMLAELHDNMTRLSQHDRGGLRQSMDSVQSFHGVEDEDDNNEEELVRLRRQLKESQIANADLKEQLKRVGRGANGNSSI